MIDEERDMSLRVNGLNIAEYAVGHDTGQDSYEESIADHSAKVCRQ
ncbi:MAG: hypothetical protein HGB21_04120 [Nitrospirae bacterium]|nr:hypothetical protein [Nitrospirota bacterium]NTW65491.1 hypothetical protein [Nitrospirota bacterium]